MKWLKIYLETLKKILQVKNNKLKGYTGPIILCGLIGLYVFLTAYKKLKSFPKTSHLTDEQRSRIFKNFNET